MKGKIKGKNYKKINNEIHLTEWEITSYYNSTLEKTEPIEKLNINELYFVIYQDLNKNNVIDSGEYYKIKFNLNKD